MAMTPAEPSRPGRKWSGRGATTWAQDPFWSVVVILFFVLGLYLTTSGALTLANQSSGSDNGHSSNLPFPLIECVSGVAIVSGLLYIYSAHPRTRSASTSASLSAMKIIMVLAGLVVFVGGALNIITTTDFYEQFALAMVSTFFVVTSLSVHLIRK